MNVCDFVLLNSLTLEDAKASIKRYSSKYRTWLFQYDKFFGTTRSKARSDKRMIELLTIVRGSGWNMNRQGQCAHIIRAIEAERISREELDCF